MANLPQRFPFTLAAGGTLSARLDTRCWSVIVSNFTAQYLEILDANDFVPPNTRQILSLPGVLVGQANFAAPSGVVQPIAISGQQAYLTYTEQVLPPSGGVVGATALASVTQLERFTKALLPAPGNPGRLVLLTDYDRGIWKDTGTSFVSLEGETFNVKQFGAIGDGAADDTAAIQATITAAAAASPSAGKVVVPRSQYKITAALTIPSGVTVVGSQSGMSAGGAGSKGSGSVFQWFGVAGGTMVSVVDANDVHWSGVNLDGRGVAATGFLLDASAANPGANNNVFEHFSTYDFTTTHFQWGTNGALARQMDGTEIRAFKMRQAGNPGTGTGIVINSGNAAQYSSIECGTFQQLNKGVDCQWIGGLLKLERLAFGTLSGAGSSDITLTVVTDIDIATCQGEAGVKFLNVAGAGSTLGTITLRNNKFDEPVTITRVANIVSIANSGAGPATVTGGASVVVSIGDTTTWTMTTGILQRFGQTSPTYGFRFVTAGVLGWAIAGALNLIGSTIALVNGANQNVAIAATDVWVFITGPTLGFSIGGFVGGTDGRVLKLRNTSGQILTINYNDGGSIAGNKIFTPTTANVVLGAFSTCELVYDSNAAQWILMSYIV